MTEAPKNTFGLKMLFENLEKGSHIKRR